MDQFVASHLGKEEPGPTVLSTGIGADARKISFVFLRICQRRVRSDLDSNPSSATLWLLGLEQVTTPPNS